MGCCRRFRWRIHARAHVHVSMMALVLLDIRVVVVYRFMLLPGCEQIEQGNASQVIMAQGVQGAGSQRAWHEADGNDALDQDEREQSRQRQPAIPVARGKSSYGIC